MSNTTVGYTEGTGKNVGVDDLGAAGLIQRIKLVLGDSGSDGGNVSPANPLPTTQADGSNATMGSKADAAWDGSAGSATMMAVLKKIGNQSVSGTVTVTGTAASVQSGSWNVGVSGTVTTTQAGTVAVTQTGAVSVTGTAAAVQSGTWNVGVNGTVTTTQGTVTVTGTAAAIQSGSWTVATTGTVQITQTGSVTVTGTAAAVQSGAWNVTVTGTAASVQSGTWTVETTGTVNVTHGTVTVTGTAASIQSGTWNIGINTVGTVAVTATAKGTQTTNFIGVQQAKDSGRTALNMYAVNASPAATTVETAVPCSVSFGVTNTVTTTSTYVISTGKTLRIEQITLGLRGNATTATLASATISLRVPATGGVTITATPVVHQWRLAVPATTGGVDRLTIPFPEGLEIPGNGARSIGFTGNATFVTNAPNWDVSFTGYEY